MARRRRRNQGPALLLRQMGAHADCAKEWSELAGRADAATIPDPRDGDSLITLSRRHHAVICAVAATPTALTSLVPSRQEPRRPLLSG